MPPRSEEELDPVTLHNQALIGLSYKASVSSAACEGILSGSVKGVARKYVGLLP